MSIFLLILVVWILVSFSPQDMKTRETFLRAEWIFVYDSQDLEQNKFRTIWTLGKSMYDIYSFVARDKLRNLSVFSLQSAEISITYVPIGHQEVRVELTKRTCKCIAEEVAIFAIVSCFIIYALAQQGFFHWGGGSWKSSHILITDR